MKSTDPPPGWTRLTEVNHLRYFGRWGGYTDPWTCPACSPGVAEFIRIKTMAFICACCRRRTTELETGRKRTIDFELDGGKGSLCMACSVVEGRKRDSVYFEINSLSDCVKVLTSLDVASTPKVLATRRMHKDYDLDQMAHQLLKYWQGTPNIASSSAESYRWHARWKSGSDKSAGYEFSRAAQFHDGSGIGDDLSVFRADEGTFCALFGDLGYGGA